MTQAPAWVACLVAAGILLAQSQPAGDRRLNAAVLGLLLVVGCEPLPNAALRALERQYPALVDFRIGASTPWTQ